MAYVICPIDIDISNNNSKKRYKLLIISIYVCL